MEIVNFSTLLSPCWFWIVAFIWSAFQGYTGYWYGVYIYDSNALDKYVRPMHVRPFAYGFHHAAFYCLSSLSGFTACYLALWISQRITMWSEISGGLAAILTALLLIAVLGMSGSLPRILFLGKNPLK